VILHHIFPFFFIRNRHIISSNGVSNIYIILLYCFKMG